MPQRVENDPVAPVGNAVIESKRIRHRSEKRAYAHPAGVRAELGKNKMTTLLVRQGFQHLPHLSGHMGNTALLALAVQDGKRPFREVDMLPAQLKDLPGPHPCIQGEQRHAPQVRAAGRQRLKQPSGLITGKKAQPPIVRLRRLDVSGGDFPFLKAPALRLTEYLPQQGQRVLDGLGSAVPQPHILSFSRVKRSCV